MRSLLQPTGTHIASRWISSGFAHLREFVHDVIATLSLLLQPGPAPTYALVPVRIQAPRRRSARPNGRRR